MSRPLVGYSLIADAYDLSDFPAALDEAAALGVDTVELPLFALHLVADARLVERRIDALAGILAGRRLGWSGHGPLAVNLMDRPDNRARHVAVAEATIAVAARLGVRHLVFHAGWWPAAEPEAAEAGFVRQRDDLRRLGDVAGAAGVRLAIETVFAIRDVDTATPGRLAEEIAAVDHPAVAACLDVGHSAIQCTRKGLDLLAEVRALAPFTAHIHVNDGFGRPADLWTFHPSESLAYGIGDLHLPLGWGAIPWADVLAFPFPAGVWLNLELSARYWPELPDCIGRVKALAEETGPALSGAPETDRAAGP